MRIIFLMTFKAYRRCPTILTVCVTCAAVCLLVRSSKWKGTLLVIEYTAPRFFVMTDLTLFSELSFVIIIAMATGTGCCDAGQLPIGVTLFAGYGLVRSAERKTRDRVIHVGIFPISCVVAGLTSTTKTVLMDIILLMARDACHRHAGNLATLVAVLAYDINMPTIHREAGERVVKFEVDEIIPCCRPVTRFAILTQTTFMNIILLVTGYASIWNVDPLTFKMAIFARQGSVPANQRKSGQTMVEGSLHPGVLIVAGGTILPQTPLMDVLLLMAANAGRKGGLKVIGGPGVEVAIRTSDIGVSSVQRK